MIGSYFTDEIVEYPETELKLSENINSSVFFQSFCLYPLSPLHTCTY